MSNNEYKKIEGDEERGWHYEAPAQREQMLERRIIILELAVYRLEKELRLMKMDDAPLDNLNTIRNVTKNLNIGALGGTIGRSELHPVHPISPYKAD
jgi:hypothetical protein